MGQQSARADTGAGSRSTQEPVGQTGPLRASDPQNTLKRGFALLYTTDGTLLHSIDQVQKHTTITTCLSDGRVTNTVTGKEKQP